jgi:hypothetical protein
MRRIITRIVRTVTTVTWSIRWDEDVIGGNAFTGQTPSDNLEQTHPALPEGQPPSKTSDPYRQEEMIDAKDLTNNAPLRGAPSSPTIHEIHSTIDQGEEL